MIIQTNGYKKIRGSENKTQSQTGPIAMEGLE